MCDSRMGRREPRFTSVGPPGQAPWWPNETRPWQDSSATDYSPTSQAPGSLEVGWSDPLWGLLPLRDAQSVEPVATLDSTLRGPSMARHSLSGAVWDSK